MGYGIFGKLPAKRDFVAQKIPRSVLEPFETWLQSAVAASRNGMGQDWEEAYLVSPIWRFWFGPATFGRSLRGALMPSVDKVGRYFPLAIVHVAQEGAVSPSPLEDGDDDWFEALESVLLGCLDEEADPDTATLFQDLPQPALQPIAEGSAGVTLTGSAGTQWSDFLADCKQADHASAMLGRSYWWTTRGGAGPASFHCANGMPDPYFYVEMLTPPAEEDQPAQPSLPESGVTQDAAHATPLSQD